MWVISRIRPIKVKTSLRSGSNVSSSSSRYLVQGVLNFKLKSNGAPPKFGCSGGSKDSKLWGL